MRKKRVLALIMTLVMLFAMTATAMADDAKLDGGVVDHTHNTTTSAENSVLILKELVIYNTDGKDIYLPTVDYTYTITEATDADGVGQTVTDSEGVSGEVYADAHDGTDGRALQTTSATVSFSPATTAGYDAAGVTTAITQPMTAASTGTSVFGGFSVAFDPTNFDHAGVYRYKITESTENRTTAGITTGTDTSAVRFLDVYVRKYNDEYQIYGYVCFTDATSAITPATAADAKKTNGFVHGGNSVATVADQYQTKNLVVKKVFGTSLLNQTGHEFPVKVVLTGTGATGAWINAADSTGTKVSGFTTDESKVYVAFDATSKTLDVTLSKDKTLTLYGIPQEVSPSVTVKETNDTYDAYKVTVEAENSSTTATGIADAIVVANSESSVSNTVAIDKSSTTEITITNDLTELSPTGLIFRFGPYILMLLGGIVLLVLGVKFMRRSKKENETA
ncbi:MAG: hypothetical protein IK055_01070 [Lachnospiraceae bacterium]|nr:hypothetical protein [Lachnospiraceae bacterium]